MTTIDLTSSERVELLEHKMAHAKHAYKRARRRLLELAVWDDPTSVMGVYPSGYRRTSPDDFETELRYRAHAVAVAFDRYTEYQVQLSPDVPKL